MHTQIKTIPSVRHAIPTGLNNQSFCFKNCFRLGDEKDTNVSSRSKDFGDLFLPVANCKCDMPGGFYFYDVPEQQMDTAQIFMTTHAPEAEDKSWYCRVPIKLVGHLKDLQKKGKRGTLLTDGNPNFFLCRNHEKQLALVELKFHGSSWSVNSLPWHGDSVLEGPCRFFVACRK